MKTSSFVEPFARVVSLVVGRDVRAAPALREIAQVGTKPTSRRIPKARETAVLARDHYTCRYCGRQMISNAVMRAVSVLFPDDFIYHVHAKADVCDVAFWRDCTTVDHKTPVTRGGSNEADNLVAACWPCNVAKGNLTLEEFQDEHLLPITATSWDGLSGQLAALVEMLPPMPPATSYFRSWLQAVRFPEPLGALHASTAPIARVHPLE